MRLIAFPLRRGALLLLAGFALLAGAPAHSASGPQVLGLGITAEPPGVSSAARRKARWHDGVDYAKNYVTPEGNFSIWYNESGFGSPVDATDADADGVPDYVETVGEAFEYAWQVEIVDMGYSVPVDADRYLFNVWLESLSGVYGYAVYDPTFSTSYAEIVIDSGLGPEENYKYLRLTGVHEFFHAIQVAYDTNQPLWWMEGTAVWMEEQALSEYDGYVDYIYPFLSTPEIGFDVDAAAEDEADLREYAAFLLAQYLSQSRGVEAVRSLWEAARSGLDMPAALSTLGLTGEEALREMYAWLYTGGFAEQADWPALQHHATHTIYPVAATPSRRLPDAYGANYILFRPPTGEAAATLEVTFTGLRADGWTAALVAVGAAGETAAEMAFQASGTTLRLGDFGGEVAEACLITIPTRPAADACPYRYEARLARDASSGEAGETTAEDETGGSEGETGASETPSPAPDGDGEDDPDAGDSGATAPDDGAEGDTADDGGETPAPVPLSADLELNGSFFSAGDRLALTASTDGEGVYDLYILVTTPGGTYFSLVGIDAFGPPNTPVPILRSWPVQRVNDVPVLDIAWLPPMPPGTYVASIYLVEPDADIFYTPYQRARQDRLFIVR